MQKIKKALRKVAAAVPVVNPDSKAVLAPLSRTDLIPAERVVELVNADDKSVSRFCKNTQCFV